MATCPSCGEQNPERFRFCGACGTALATPVGEPRETRKVVTVLFCDVVDSTPLGERLDPESLRQVMGRYFDVARATLSRHGGEVEKFIGDAVMAVFGIPVLHEDDALRAVRAAADLRDALVELNVELEHYWGVALTLRMGVNTGQVVAGDPAAGRTLVTGDAVNLAARLEQAAGAGEILIGDATRRLVRDAVIAEPVAPLALKGKTEAIPAWRLTSVTPGASGHARRLDTPLIGRARERRLVGEAFERMTAESACHLFTLLGPAGVGKSRLVHELVEEVRGVSLVLRGRCLEYGEGITFSPIAEIVREAVGAGIGADAADLRGRLEERLAGQEHGGVVAERIAALVTGGEGVGPPEEIPWTVRKLFEGLAAERPFVVIVDDLHWAEPTLLDLLEHVADWSRDAPILLLCIARPELLDKRPMWGGGKFNATTILLEPLPAGDCEALIDNLLGGAVMDFTVRDRIVTAAEGNPLFVEEFVAMLVEDGLLVREDDGWVATADFAEALVPPSISALLAARLDRLDLRERSVMERASVVGKTFYRNAVTDLSPAPTREQVQPSLMALVRKELIRPDRSGLPGDDAFRFRHLLIRDAAYASLPKRERAELHERFATWLESVSAREGVQYDEVLGHHLEQAHRHRIELGHGDAAAAELARRASRHLHAAGMRALGRFDVQASVSLLERAWGLAAGGDERAVVGARLGEALVRSGCLNRAEEIVTLAGQDATPSAVEASTRIALVRAELRLATAAEAWRSDGLDELEALVRQLQARRDDADLARALNLLGRAYWIRGSVSRADEVTQQALEHARTAGDARQAGEALGQLAFCTLIGPTPVAEGLRRCEELLEQVGDDRRLRSSLLQTLAGLHALAGSFDESRRLFAESGATLMELGLELEAAQGRVLAAMGELYAGDPVGAEAEARRAFDVLESMGERPYLASAGALLALALHLQGLHHEAARFAGVSEENAGAEDLVAQVQWRTARARVLAADGEVEQAEALAREAVVRAAAGDLPTVHGDSLLELAAILRKRGEWQAALEAARTAAEMMAAKGATALATLAGAVVEELGDERQTAR